MTEYFKMTRSGTYGFLVAIPLLIGYEVSMFMARQIDHSTVVATYAQLFKRLVILMGADNGLLLYLGLGALLIITGIVVIFAERKKNIKLKWQYFCIMIAESFIYVPILLFVVAWLTGVVVPAIALAAGTSSGQFFTKFGLSIGAGVYEELVFRVILIGLIYVISKYILESLMDFGENSKKASFIAWLIAANIGSLIFSWVHFIGPLGDDFTMVAFIFRYFAGIVLFALYLFRGFGIAAWTHAIYDVIVMLFWNA